MRFKVQYPPFPLFFQSVLVARDGMVRLRQNGERIAAADRAARDDIAAYAGLVDKRA
jgi:hypothetical protein